MGTSLATEQYNSQTMLKCPKCGKKNKTENHTVKHGFEKISYRGECAGSEVSGYNSKEVLFVYCSCCNFLLKLYLPLDEK